jgi:hypothetical protein
MFEQGVGGGGVGAEFRQEEKISIHHVFQERVSNFVCFFAQVCRRVGTNWRVVCLSRLSIRD